MNINKSLCMYVYVPTHIQPCAFYLSLSLRIIYLTLFCFFLSLYFATYHFSGHLWMCPVERLIASPIVCVSLCACDYSLCYVSCCGPILPPSLPSPALSRFLSLSMCLCHSSSGTLRAQRSGWSTSWSRWLVVWHGLTLHGVPQAKGCQPKLPLATVTATQQSRPCLNGHFACLKASCLIRSVKWYTTPSSKVLF